MPIIWDGYLVALSVMIAIFGSFSALSHTENMRENTGKAALPWMIAGAATLGVTIWSMHFVGMLAFHLPIPIAYDVPLTLLSILPSIGATLAGFMLLRNKAPRLKRTIVAGICMGLGVALMHYTGMAALKMQPAISYDPLIFLLSVVIAVLASIAALQIIFVGNRTGLSSLKQQSFGAVIMALAIAGMHYTAMQGANFATGSVCAVAGARMEPTLLALIVTSVVLILFSGGSLASLIDRRIALDRLRETHQTLKEHDEQLQRAEDKLSGILDSIPMIVWSMSAAHEMLYVNPAACVIYGRAQTALTADAQLWISIVHPDDRARVVQWLQQAATADAPTLQYRIVRPDGSLRWLEDRVQAIRDTDGSIVRLDGVAADISERKLRDERIEYLANFDPLTGLPNRNLLMNRIEHALIQARRSQRGLGLLFLDIDRFKHINDSFGHAFGDSMLKECAVRIKSILREGDTVARLGGDEFVIVLADIREYKNAARLALKVLNAFAQPVSVQERELHVTTSIGVSVYPEDGDEADTLLKHADAALYRAKDKGRNCFQSYTLEMGSQVIERMKLEHALHKALGNNEFALHYQPKVDLESGEIRSVEALIRWQHPTLGAVSPARFIGLAEETGLIIPIGEWVLKTACAQAAAWRQAGYPLSVAVNVSGRQFEQKDLPQLVQSVLKSSDLDPACLELELTESMLMSDSEATIRILKSLRAIGVKLSIDDFGTGFSSLSYLTRFPIDIIKIDQSFIFDLAKTPEAASITLTVIALAKALGLKTIAEGVETAEQLDFLLANGCDAIQGYYFSRPLPVDQMTELLRRGVSLSLKKNDAIPAR